MAHPLRVSSPAASTLEDLPASFCPSYSSPSYWNVLTVCIFTNAQVRLYRLTHINLMAELSQKNEMSVLLLCSTPHEYCCPVGPNSHMKWDDVILIGKYFTAEGAKISKWDFRRIYILGFTAGKIICIKVIIIMKGHWFGQLTKTTYKDHVIICVSSECLKSSVTVLRSWTSVSRHHNEVVPGNWIFQLLYKKQQFFSPTAYKSRECDADKASVWR